MLQSRNHRRFRGVWRAAAHAACAAALLLCAAAPAAFAAPPAETSERAGAVGSESAAFFGAFCTASSCRGASRWTPVAFGAAVLAIAWTARRDSTPAG